MWTLWTIEHLQIPLAVVISRLHHLGREPETCDETGGELLQTSKKAMASNLRAMASNPKGGGLQPKSGGFQPKSDGLQPKSDESGGELLGGPHVEGFQFGERGRRTHRPRHGRTTFC